MEGILIEVSMGLKKTVEKNIYEYKMFEPGDKILIGVSGGADSLCLLHVIQTIGKEQGWGVAAAHLNHCFRGAEADRDQAHVVKICREWGVPLLDRKIDVQAIADEKKMTSEEAGREARYALFEEAMEKFNCNKTAVAQNMRDQAETVLLNLVRGSGIEGLKGMEFARGRLFRPLLNLSREAIEHYCAENGIEYMNDSTNFEPIYARNKVRLQLLPYLKENFNSAIVETLYRLSRTASEENDLLEQLGRTSLAKLRAKGGAHETAPRADGKLRIQAEGLRNLHPALAKRVLRSALREVAGSLKGIEKRHIDAALRVAGEHTGSACQLPNRIRIEKSYAWLILSREEPNPIKEVEKKGQKCYHVLVYGENMLSNGTVIEMDRIESSSRMSLTGEKKEIYIDPEKIKTQLVARNRMEGDRFTPIGMSGSKKLKNFLIDRKIPKEKRDRLLLICDGQEVVWVIGDVISEKYKLTEKTKERVKIKMIQGEL